MSPPPTETSVCGSVLPFDSHNRLAVTLVDGKYQPAFPAAEREELFRQLATAFPVHTSPREAYTQQSGPVFFSRVDPGVSGRADSPFEFHSLDELSGAGNRLSPELRIQLQELEPHLAEVPYLELAESEFIYRFRPAGERNEAVYTQDAPARALYQSRLCAAIKELARQHERNATDPVPLDFGAVTYLLPSHFGFCLGVRNAIERAYETLAQHPDRRVFMLSELIHNPFVNNDLRQRGLRYLQTDRGESYSVDGEVASAAPGKPLLWDTLTPEDIVIIPAFGATDADKARLVRKGLPLRPYDATCMLVEKVWRAAEAHGRAGRTLIIHGKHEHEETKATFSHAARFAPAVVIRDLEEARQLGSIIQSKGPAAQSDFHRHFADRHTPGFDPARDLERVAVVNQTTLLMNETLAIIQYLRGIYQERYGDASRVGGDGRGDTLCYATQVNQDALARALAGPLDAAFVVGGRNSSNTYQLFRLCEQRLGPAAFYIQSERAILPGGQVEHFRYVPGGAGQIERRPLWKDAPVADQPRRILITGGASCPDGIIQQVIDRLNAEFPRESLRPIDTVLADLQSRTLGNDAAN